MSTQTEAQKPYKVLARKYRPQAFSDLIGQDVLVKTLSNAIRQDRLAHAFVFTGVRGVGKTTTARILARILECENLSLEDQKVEACGVCANCKAMDKDQHVDVMEMDAASRTGVDDIREILDGVRYKPVMGKYKIYIIDEVHMLSKQAFNALLKTLEEPPEHVKFIFATTEIRRVPVTILSRCQRFDLLRVGFDILAQHLQKVSHEEGVELSDEALSVIARISEGSVRDALSILDQAVAQKYMGDEKAKIEASDIRQMIGMVDRIQSFELLELLLKGKIREALQYFAEMFAKGADPILVLQEAAELTHMVLRHKVMSIGQGDQENVDTQVLFSDVERNKLSEMSSAFSVPTLTQAWQVFLKGIQETQMSGHPHIAAEMILIRLAYLSEQPTLWDISQQANKASTTSDATPASPQLNTGGGHGEGVASIHSASGNYSTGNYSTGNHSTSSLSTSSSPGSADKVATKSCASHIVNGSLALNQAYLPHENEQVVENNQQIHDVECFEDIIKLCDQKKEPLLKSELMSYVHLINFAKNKIDIRLSERASTQLPGKLSRFLEQCTNEKWFVSLQNEGGQPTLKEQRAQAFEKHEKKVMQDKVLQRVLHAFPGSKVRSIKINNDSVIIK